MWISKFKIRLPVWLLAVVFGAWFIGETTIDFSRMIAERWDKSAMAWTIALPFMSGVWLADSASFVFPVALLYECISWISSRRQFQQKGR